MPRLSRRKVVAALGSAPLLKDGRFTTRPDTHPVLVLCAHYAELARRQEHLMLQWGDREAWLGDNRAAPLPEGANERSQSRFAKMDAAAPGITVRRNRGCS